MPKTVKHRKLTRAKANGHGSTLFEIYYNTGVDYMGVQMGELLHVAYLAADYVGLTRLPKKGTVVSAIVGAVSSVRV